MSIAGGSKGGGGGGAAQRTPIIAPDSTRSQAIVEVVEAWSWGEIAGFPPGADPLEYVYLDGTPIKANGVLNFQGVTFDYRLGTQDQTYIPGRVDDSIGAPVVVDVPVVYATPVIRTVTDPSTDAVSIVLTFAALVVQNTTNGDRTAPSVVVQIEVRPAGSSIWTAIDLNGRAVISDKTEAAYQRSFHINLRAVSQSASSYDIRVSRVSADPVNGEQSAFRWSSYDKLTYAKLRRPNIAHCRLTFDTRYFSAIPVRSYRLRGWLIQVPHATVYDPVARTYTGADWNGTLVKAWCRNPAWFLYHLLTTAGAGLGDDINPAYQDKWAVYTIAQRCDQLVPDGNGGWEPRYSIDAQFMAQTSAHDMIQSIAGIFDAQALWDGKSVYLTQDAPKATRSLYLPANVVGGRFRYAGSARQTRYTAALIQYNDPTDLYRLNTEYVEDFDGIGRYGYLPKTETAVGCTSRGEAHRRGKRLLVTSREEIDSVSFSTGLSGINDRPGDIVRIADPLRSVGQRMGGRLSTGSTTSSIKLDAPVTLANNTSYRLAIIGNDGAVWDTAITNASGSSYSTLSITPAFAQAPEQELEWIVYDPLAVGQLFRILGIAENDDKSNGFYTLTATQYAPGKFAEIDDTADLEAIPDNPYIVSGVIPPSGVQTSEGVYTGLEGLRRYIDISWTASNDPLLRGYHLSYKFNGTQIFDKEIGGQSYRIDNPLMGEYEITLAAVNIAGKYSSSITVIHNLGELYAITAVHITNLALPSGTTDFTGRDALFSWSTDADTVLGSTTYATGKGGQSPWFRDFEIRVYNGATLLRTEYVTENYYSYTFEKNNADGGPRRTFTVKVRARDYYGRYSQEAVLTATNPPPSNFGAVSLVPGIKSIFLNYIQPTDPDYKYTRIYASQTQGFTPSDATLVGETTDRVTSFPAAVVGLWYVRLQGVDAFGVSGTVYSTEISTTVFVADIGPAVDAILANPGRTGDVVIEATRFLVVQPGQASPKTAVFGVGQVDGLTKVGVKGDLLIDGSIYGRSIAANQVTADKISVTTLSAVSADMGTVTAGTFKTSPVETGYRVELSDVGSYPIWYGSGSKLAANAKFYLDTSGNAFFGGSINVNGRFVVNADGTVTILDAVGGVIFASGTGVKWGYVEGRPTALSDLDATANTKLAGIAAGATKSHVYRQTTAPTGGSYSTDDLWVDTDSATGSTHQWNGAGWVPIADVTSANLAGSGVNILNPRYCTFEEAGLPLVVFANGTAVQDTVGFFGGKSLKLSATGADNWCYLAASGTDYNFSIQPNKKWLLSVCIRCSAASKPAQLYIRTSTAGAYTVVNVTTPAAINTWDRVYGVVDLSADASTQALLRVDNEGGAGVDMWFDGFMLEQQIGDLTTPSAYHEPPNFLTTFIGDLAATQNNLYRQATAPTGGTYTTNDLWFDTDSNPAALYQWNSAAWEVVSNTITDTSQLVDGANLGLTAAWSSVTSRPTSLATLNATDGSTLATAASNATAALAAISDMASDSILSPVEKAAVRREWEAIASEKQVIEGQATTYSITTEKTTYTSAFQALANYLNAGVAWTTGLPSWVSDANLAANTTINGGTFRTTFKAYYDARVALVKKVTDTASTNITAAGLTAIWTSITSRPTSLATLNATDGSTLTTAASNATSALSLISDMASDSILSPVEKAAVRREWEAIASEKAVIEGQATTYSITTEKTTYTSAFQALANYLNAGVAWTTGLPSWVSDANLAANTTINGGTFRTTFKAYYDARVALVKKVTDTASTNIAAAGLTATWTSITSRPTSLATLNTTDGNTLATAASNATAALAAISDMASDSILSPVEKPAVRKEWVQLLAEKPDLEAQADAYAVTTKKTAYTAAFQALANYLNGGVAWVSPSVPDWILDANLSTATAINQYTFRTTFSDYYNARVALINAINDVAATRAVWTSVTSRPTSLATLNATDGSTLTTAASNATSALSLISDMASDSILSPVEKAAVRREWEAIASEKAVIEGQATTYSITTEKTTYTSAFQALANYLNAGVAWTTGLPSWVSDANLAANTTINGGTFRTTFKAYYDARVALIKKVTDASGQVATWTGVTGANKPADNADVTLSKLGGSGVNILNPRYTAFEEAALPPVTFANGSITQGVVGNFGNKSLKLSATGVDNWCFLGASGTDYNFAIQPNKKWLLSVYIRCSAASKPAQLYIRTSTAGTYTVVSVTTPAAINTWDRVYGVVNLSADASTQALLRVDNEGGAGVDMWFDGFMLEQQIGDLTTPSAYHEPPNFLTVYTGDIAATKNNVFRTGGTVPVGEYGDIWYVTTATSGYIVGATYLFHTGAWQKTADITTSQLAGSGVNVLNPRYARFEELTLPPMVVANGSKVRDSVSCFGNHSLRLSATAAGCYAYLGASSADYNFAVQPNKKWIVSCYVRCSAASKIVQLYIRTSAAGDHYFIEATTSPAPNTWARVSGVIDLSADASTLGLSRVDNRGGAGVDMWFDGLMLEQQIGDLTTPSAYHEPPNFKTIYTGEDNATYGAGFDTNITGQITPSNVTTYIAGVAIGTAQIANAAITAAKIASLSVGTAQINDAAITAAKIANLAVGTAQIGDANITSLKIAGEAVIAPRVALGTTTASITVVLPIGTTVQLTGTINIDYDASQQYFAYAYVQISVGGTVQKQNKILCYPDTAGGSCRLVVPATIVFIYVTTTASTTFLLNTAYSSGYLAADGAVLTLMAVKALGV
jgi:hypothetical protein